MTVGGGQLAPAFHRKALTMKPLLMLTTLGLCLTCGVAGRALADDDLYKTKNCFACHRVDRNHLGPSFRSIATKYAGDNEIEAALVKRVREGAVGVWGQTPMPAQTQVTEAEALTLVRWIREQK
jgi:cytochrome c